MSAYSYESQVFSIVQFPTSLKLSYILKMAMPMTWISENVNSKWGGFEGMSSPVVHGHAKTTPPTNNITQQPPLTVAKRKAAQTVACTVETAAAKSKSWIIETLKENKWDALPFSSVDRFPDLQP